jgi:hypothetical protein
LEKPVQLALRSVAFKTGDKSDDVQLRVTLIRQIPGPDRPDYWLGALEKPFHWTGRSEPETHEIEYLVLATQWEETTVRPGVTRLPVGIAFVVDPSLLDDRELDLDKIRYVALGIADDPDAPPPSGSWSTRVAGVIAGMFGKGETK